MTRRCFLNKIMSMQLEEVSIFSGPDHQGGAQTVSTLLYMYTVLPDQVRQWQYFFADCHGAQSKPRNDTILSFLASMGEIRESRKRKFTIASFVTLSHNDRLLLDSGLRRNDEEGKTGSPGHPGIPEHSRPCRNHHLSLRTHDSACGNLYIIKDLWDCFGRFTPQRQLRHSFIRRGSLLGFAAGMT
jgi:hypothetical protein